MRRSLRRASHADRCWGWPGRSTPVDSVICWLAKRGFPPRMFKPSVWDATVPRWCRCYRGHHQGTSGAKGSLFRTDPTVRGGHGGRWRGGGFAPPDRIGVSGAWACDLRSAGWSARPKSRSDTGVGVVGGRIWDGGDGAGCPRFVGQGRIDRGSGDDSLPGRAARLGNRGGGSPLLSGGGKGYLGSRA